jgi:hypothetical protein
LKRLVPILLTGVLLFSCATTGTASKESGAEPAPYEKDEFPPALVKLRRGEVLFFGSLPLFYMFTSLGYDSIVQSPPSDTNDVLYQKMMISLSLSGVLAIADFIVGEVEEGKQ